MSHIKHHDGSTDPNAPRRPHGRNRISDQGGERSHYSIRCAGEMSRDIHLSQRQRSDLEALASSDLPVAGVAEVILEATRPDSE